MASLLFRLTVPLETLTTFLLPALTPLLVMLGPFKMVRPLLVNVALVGLNMLPPVTVTPAPLTVVTPVSTPPVTIPRPLTVVPFNKLPVLTLPVVPRFKLSLSSTSILPFFTRVSMLLLEPTTSTACPNGFCTVLPSAAFSAKPLLIVVVLFPTASLVAYN